jgi:Domain of unknown function (DUF2019)
MIVALTKQEIEQMLAEYVEAAIVHADANKAGDTDTAAACAQRKIDIYRRLKRDGQDALTAFHVLLEHPDPKVRASVAGYGLEFAPKESEQVLEELAKLAPDPIGVSAGMALFVWRSGNFEFPD